MMTSDIFPVSEDDEDATLEKQVCQPDEQAPNAPGAIPQGHVTVEPGVQATPERWPAKDADNERSRAEPRMAGVVPGSFVGVRHGSWWGFKVRNPYRSSSVGQLESILNISAENVQVRTSANPLTCLQVGNLLDRHVGTMSQEMPPRRSRMRYTLTKLTRRTFGSSVRKSDESVHFTVQVPFSFLIVISCKVVTHDFLALSHCQIVWRK